MTAAQLRRNFRPEMSPEEWELRVKLAATYRILQHFGWVEAIYGHVTVRVPGPERHFLINPWGLRYDEITASNLLKIDLDGNVVGDSDYPVLKAGFIIHSAVHQAREDAHCVMHTHTTAGGPSQSRTIPTCAAISTSCSLLEPICSSRAYPVNADTHYM